MDRNKVSKSNDSGFLNRNTQYVKEESKDEFAFHINENVSASVRTK